MKLLKNPIFGLMITIWKYFKLLLGIIEKIKQKLLETGFIYQKTVVETDTYFISDHYDMRKKDKALRIRKTENLDTGEVKAQLNCKGPKLDQVSMTRKETEIDIYEPEKMEDILKELEFYPASCRVKKTRGYYIKDHMTAAADKVENLGNFLELEIIVAKEDTSASVAFSMMDRSASTTFGPTTGSIWVYN